MDGEHEAATQREHRERMQVIEQEQRAKVRAASESKGVIVVHTGDGKGKSTAAFGIALRAIGNGLRVGLVQFIKGTWQTGEQVAIRQLSSIDHVVSGDGFTWRTQDREQDVASVRRGWDQALEMMAASQGPDPKYGVLILDELNVALRYDYLPIEEVVHALKNKPAALHVVVTGRDARPELVELADTVTEMKVVKHAFDAGIQAQRGIEF